MASAEARAGYAVNRCFRQDFRMPPNSSDHSSSVSKNLESDWTPSDSINYLDNSGSMPHNTNSDCLPDMKWWLHVKTNLGGDTNYTCQHLNSWEPEPNAFSMRLLGDNVKTGGDRSVNNSDDLSCVGSATTIAVEQPWNVSHKCMKKINDTRMPKIEAAMINDLHLTPKKKNQGEFWLPDGQFVDNDITSFLESEHIKRTSFDLEPHWMGAEKAGPWWFATGKDDLASLVAQKSLEHIENCDLPEPHIKPFRQIPSLQPTGIDHDNNALSSLNQKAEMCSSNANGCTSGTLTSGCSFQDSDRTFSSSESRDCDSSNKDGHANSRSNDKSELLRALCHSQTRAREAEKAAQEAYKEKEHILSLFFRQASQLFAYKLWLHVLQLENLCLQLRNKNQPLLNLFPVALPSGLSYKKSPRKIKARRRRRNCAAAFVVGLALAGAGLLLGWTLGCILPPF